MCELSIVCMSAARANSSLVACAVRSYSACAVRELAVHSTTNFLLLVVLLLVLVVGNAQLTSVVAHR